MTKLYISYGNAVSAEPPQTSGLRTLIRQDKIHISGANLFHRWRNDSGDDFFLLGDIIGLRQTDGMLSPPSLVKLETKRLENPERIPEIAGRFVLVALRTTGECDVWADQYGRIDVYWQSVDNGFALGTSLDLLPISKTGSPPDTVGVAHALTVYGSRPAKQHTLYQGVHRLGVNQGIRLKDGGHELLQREFKPLSTQPPFVERDLNRYSDFFLEAIRARASNDGNVVYLSSGWDSSSILASLVHLFGNRKVRAVIGRMRYAERSGIINQFELDRATAIAEYFGVRLDIVEWDYRNNGRDILSNLQGLFRSQQFGFLQSNHYLLAQETAKTANGDEMIFAGEISDGAHNLGFSQFVSIFHPKSLEFREYSDKMLSYLFGPTFLGQLKGNKQEQDPIWNIFAQRNSNVKFDPLRKGDRAVTQQLLASFFLRGGRIPLYSLDNAGLLTAEGREHYSNESERIYLSGISDQVTEDNLYSWYLHLYNTFHWQGSTVATIEHTAEAHGLRCVFPFHDSAVINFLSAMPESWGRGLDLKPTKYPLKWFLSNRIDYPHHLQVGPHSYIYDTQPDFSLLGELLYASSFKQVYFESLKESGFIEWLNASMFDRSYIDGIIDRYLKGEELRGQEMNDLCVLAMHSAIGVYGK